MEFKNKYVNLLVFLFILLLGKDNIFAQTRTNGELWFEAEGININEYWEVSFRSLSNPRWFDDDGEKFITNDYKAGFLYGYGNNPTYDGFDSPDDVDGGLPVAYGEYRFLLEFDEHSFSPSIILDLYDANWSTQGYPGSRDIYIKWNNNNQKFYYKNECTLPNYELLGDGSSGQYFQIWELFNVETNQQPFQLPPPDNFMCFNPSAYGAHPEFYWKEFDGSSGFCILYKIYRVINHGDFECIASSIVSNSYIDNEVTLGASSNRFTYYVTAYTENSPESSPSRWVYIFGGISKQFAITDSNKYLFSKGKNTNSISMTIYPNPCNPTAKISYFVQKHGSVRISI